MKLLDDSGGVMLLKLSDGGCEKAVQGGWG